MEIESLLKQYLQALEKGCYEDIMELFADGAVVNSPLYGRVEASHFYRELSRDTIKSVITLLDVFTSERKGAAHFSYEWILKDGTKTSFECVDIAEFSCDGKIKELTIIYDTYEVRKSFEKIRD